MKKLLFFLALIFIFTVSLSFAAPIGKITQVQGRVDVLKTGKNMVAPVSLGAPVDIGDIYRAKTNSKAEITFINNNILRIAPATKIEIKEYMAEGNRSSAVMRLHRGRVQAISGEEFVKRVAAFAEGNKFEVHTPNAVAGIRGSDMLVGFNQGTTVVIFIAGHGYLYNPGMPQLITPIVTGQMSFVTGEGTPTVPVKASEAFISGGGEAFIQIETKKELPKEPPPPPPPPIYVPYEDRNVLKGENFAGTMLAELTSGSSGQMDLTLIANIPPNQSSGTMSASGTYTMSGEPKIISGDVEGASDKGGLFYGLTGGVIGSWGATSSALYVEGGSVGLLRASLLGTLNPTGTDPETGYIIGTASGSGILALQKSLGTIPLSAPESGQTPLDVFKNFVDSSTPYPVYISPSGPSWAFGEAVILDTSVNSIIDYKGITTNEGKKIAIILEKASGIYTNNGPSGPPYSLAGGMLGFKDTSANAYLLGPAIFTDNGANKMSMVVSYEYIDTQYMGYRDMLYYGTYDGYPPDTVPFRWMGTGAQVLTPTDFGGEWYNSTIYNNDGYWAWNGCGGDCGVNSYFGFLKRADGNYKFLAIGKFYDYDYGTEDFGRPYIWSGAMYDPVTEYRDMEAFTGGIWKKANPSDTYGTMAGYAAAVYYTEDRKVGLVKGNLTGNFYEMYYDSYVSGMWKAESGASGLTTIDKTASLPAGFDVTTAGIDSGSLYAYAAGGFTGSTENTIFGEYYNGKTKFITYYDASYGGYKSLPFGIYNLKLGEGSDYNYYYGKPAGASVTWSAKIGADGYFGYNSSDEGYWLAGITGTWNEYSSGAEHGTINGALSGKYITSTHLGTIGGPFYGLYTQDGTGDDGKGYGTWVGLSVGTYQSTSPLTSSLKFSTSDPQPTSLWRALLPGTYYEGRFTQSDASGNNRHDYRFEYIKTDGMGYGKVNDEMGLYSDKFYFPNDTMWKKDQAGNTSVGPPWDIGSIEAVRTLPAWMDPNNPYFTPTDYSEWPAFMDVLEKRTDDSLDAMLGMTGYPWNTGGTPVYIIGKYTASDYNKPTIVTTPLIFGTFYPPYVEGGTPNGAYGVTMGGFIADDGGVQMAMRGLYIGPDGTTAGVLRQSTLLTGSLYKDIGMWDAEGALSATVMKSDFTNPANNPEGVDISNFSENIVNGPFVSQIMGRLTGDSGSLFGTMLNSGTTRNIKGQDWGIFTSTIWVGGFGISQGSTIPGTWSAQIGGGGQFGEYQDASPSPTWHPDSGMMLIPTLSGTLSGGVVKASTTGKAGEFMTMTKRGDISDVGVLGVYTQPSPVTPNTLYSWQGVSGGVWNTTQYFTFASSFDGSVKRFTEQHSGGYFDGSYNHYYYWYNNEERYGDITFFHDSSGNVRTQRKYETDSGPFSTPKWEEYTYNKTTNTFSGYNHGIGTSGTDYPTTYPSSFSDEFFKDFAFSQGYPVDASYNYSYTGWNFTQYGSTSAIMGGVGNLWTATANLPATVYFLGDYDHWYVKPAIFGAEIMSYNVKESSANAYTTLDGKGAYYGYIGGHEINDAIDGGIRAIYLKKIDGTTSEAGILIGSFTGTAYSQDIEMWQGQGTIYPISLMNKTIPYTDLMTNVYTTELYSYSGGTAELKANDTPIATGNFDYGLHYMVLNDGSPGSFGVWRFGIGAIGNPTASWNAVFEYVDSTRIIGAGISGTTSSNIMTGSVVGYGADINLTTPATWISVGGVKGTFDPTLNAFQVGAMGVAIETNTFLAMAGTEAGKAKLQQLGIPAVQVGMVNLTQYTETSKIDSMAMNEVKFFATTGGKPQVWATGDVQGNWTATPPANHYVGLRDSTSKILLDTYVKSWSGSKWLATANGSALSGNPVYSSGFAMKGAAAGTYTGTSSGTFTGTATGHAK